MAHSKACEESRQPLSRCHCACGGALHGITAGQAQQHAPHLTPYAAMPQLNPAEREQWDSLLHAAAKLQEILSGATLVGGTAAALYAGHRMSLDADHVLADLQTHFDAVLTRLEREAGWKTNRRRAPVLILGSFHGVEQGIRQLIRKRPLETTTFEVGIGHSLRIPTMEEIVRIKGFLVVRRNTVRDYLDVAAVAEKMGVDQAAQALLQLDDFYEVDTEGQGAAKPVVTQLLKQLAEPSPVDRPAIHLRGFRGIDPVWASWEAVLRSTRRVAAAMTTALNETGTKRS